MESWILSAEPVSPAPVSRIAAPDFDEHTCAHTHARTQIHLRLRETRAAGRPSLAGVDYHGKRQDASMCSTGDFYTKVAYYHGNRLPSRFPCGLMLERLVLPKKSTPPLRTQQRRKIDFITTKQANRLKSRLTMTLTNSRLRQAINNLPICTCTSDH